MGYSNKTPIINRIYNASKSKKHPFLWTGVFCVWLLSVFLEWSCQFKSNHVVGAWKIDSTLHYYNGFTHVNKDDGFDWAICIFEHNNQMKEVKHNTYRMHRYQCSGDTIKLTYPGTETRYIEILSASLKRLVLKQEKKPIFPGNKQERFEIRYYSRVDFDTTGLLYIPASSM